jgi:hypothetical protein
MLEATLLVKDYKLDIDNILTKINVRENGSGFCVVYFGVFVFILYLWIVHSGFCVV